MANIAIAAVLLGLGSVGSAAQAQSAASEPYPNRPIRLIVPSGPGSATDLAARIFADEASRRLGRQVIADNRTGAGGRIGPEAAARAPADGYTLLWANSIGFGVLSTTAASLSYDPVKDFDPIAPVASFEIALVCNPKLVRAKNLQELIAYMKARPEQVRISSAGVGAGNHFALELFNWKAGVRTTHVPYRNPVQGIQDAVGGTLECTMDSQIVAQVEAGDLQAYAVTGPQRDPRLPNVPTMAEAGLAGYDLTWFQAIVAPAGTPRPILARLEAIAREVSADPAFRERMASAGLTPLSGGAEDLAHMIQFEIDRYRAIASQANLKFE
jgi:tripartite-type tricarboxylate transporter receptor subunit TctC